MLLQKHEQSLKSNQEIKSNPNLFEIELLTHQVISQIGYLWRAMKPNSGGNLHSTSLKLSFPGTSVLKMNKERKKESQ